jgi:hypothetical protein
MPIDMMKLWVFAARASGYHADNMNLTGVSASEGNLCYLERFGG